VLFLKRKRMIVSPVGKKMYWDIRFICLMSIFERIYGVVVVTFEVKAEESRQRHASLGAKAIGSWHQGGDSNG